MKVLDRYLIRELLLPIICCVIALIFLILIADLFDNLQELLDNRTPLAIIAKYYLFLMPHAFTETVSWASWLGAIFLLVNFGIHNEMLAMKVAGLNITTITRPILLTGLLIGIIAFLVNDRVVPKSYRNATELREIFIEKKKGREEEKLFRNVTFFSEGTRIYYFRKFYPKRLEVEDAIILWLDQSEGNSRKKMVASRGKWTGTTWEFAQGMEYKTDRQDRILGEPRTFRVKTYPELNISPQDLINASSESLFLSYRELKYKIRKLRENGVSVDAEKVDLYERLAAPWQGLVMMMISIPLLGPTRTRKAIAGSLLICVGLVFLYHVMGAISLALGTAGKLLPFASAWAANMMFAIGALFYLEKANY